MRTEGRVRRLCGEGTGSPSAGETAETQTAQSQPSVGTPIEVPVPKNVRVACIGLYRTMVGGRARRVRRGWWGLAVGGGTGEGLGDLEEAHADFEESVIQ